MISKLVPIMLHILLISLGLLLVVLGFENTFGFISCPSDILRRSSCINIFTFDVLAILGGAIVTFVGVHRVYEALR